MDPNDILGNPLHPLNPITDPYGIYGGNNSTPARNFGPTPPWIYWIVFYGCGGALVFSVVMCVITLWKTRQR